MLTHSLAQFRSFNDLHARRKAKVEMMKLKQREEGHLGLTTPAKGSATPSLSPTAAGVLLSSPVPGIAPVTVTLGRGVSDGEKGRHSLSQEEEPGASVVLRGAALLGQAQAAPA